ncbi:MAG: extracellular solute-binding protein, partial [Actinomycetota bacterium]|nr:extracellular solute-binding protein [Actinomycetota bacterium]
MKANKPSKWRAKTTVRLLVSAATIGAGGAFVGLTGTASSASTVPRSAPTVTLQFWNAYNATDKEASTMANVVLPRFEKQNPGIKVDSVVLPYADLLQKYIAAAAAGNPPAVMRSDIIWVPQLASEGVLLNLTKLPWFQPIKKAALPGPLSTNYYKGSYYGLPDDTNTQVLFWNKTDFAAAGLTGPPATFRQLVSDARRLTVKSKGQYGLGVDGTDIWNVAPYIWSNGGSFTNPDVTKATGYMNGHATVFTLQILLNLDKNGNIGSDFKGGAGAISGETGFPKGQYAMYIDGPWAVPTYAALKPKPNYGMALIPTGTSHSISTVGGEDLVIAKDVQHQADAIKLAQFLASPFAQLEMASQGDLATYSTDSAAEVKATPYLKIFVKQL